MNIFISWSGETSRLIAEKLSIFIPKIIQLAKPFYSPADIDKGAGWLEEINKMLGECLCGIVCLTKDNTEKPWILYEAGALSNRLGTARVCPILFGVTKTEVTGPLSHKQMTVFSKEDITKLMKSINKLFENQAISESLLEEMVDSFFPKFQEEVNEILKSSKDTTVTTKPKRTDRNILEEILDLVRKQNNQSERVIEKNRNALSFARKIIEQGSYDGVNSEFVHGSKVYHDLYGDGIYQGILTNKEGLKLARVLFDGDDTPRFVNPSSLV